jgi:Uri superfamily endonuclease
MEVILSNIPADPGTYMLVLNAQTEREVTIGKLGRFSIKPGYYVYSGSAFGPGGLRARIGHHLRQSSKPHWHIDFFKQDFDITEVYYISGKKCYEHRWAETLQSRPDAAIPIPRFGASDCKCPAHLFFFERRPDLLKILRATGIKNVVVNDFSEI